MALNLGRLSSLGLAVSGGAALAGTMVGLLSVIASFPQTRNHALAVPSGYGSHLRRSPAAGAYNGPFFPTSGFRSLENLSFASLEGANYGFSSNFSFSLSLTAPPEDNPSVLDLMTMTGLNGTPQNAISSSSGFASGAASSYPVNYSNLSGMNLVHGFTVVYGPLLFNPAANATSASSTISTPSAGATAPSGNLQGPAAASATIPANMRDFSQSPDGLDTVAAADTQQPFDTIVLPSSTTPVPNNSVPEPASLALLGGGLLALAFARWRLRQK